MRHLNLPCQGSPSTSVPAGRKPLVPGGPGLMELGSLRRCKAVYESRVAQGPSAARPSLLKMGGICTDRMHAPRHLVDVFAQSATLHKHAHHSV